MLRLVMDSIPQFIFWKNQQGQYLGCNKNFAQKVGISPELIVGKTDEALLANQSINIEFLQLFNRLPGSSEPEYHRIESLTRADNTPQWLDINRIPLHDSNGQIIGLLYSFEDITDRKRVEEKLRQAAKILENSTEAILITDAQVKIISVNQSFTQITGYSEIEALGKTPAQILKSGKHSPDFYEAMWQSIWKIGYWEGEIWNRRKSGELYPEWLHITVIKDETEQWVTHYLAIFSDITHHKQTEQRLIYLSHYDNLTGLPNRTLFYERVSRALQRAQQHHQLVAVMFLDLDRFKYVNDTWGHAVGDLLLIKVAHRLAGIISENDTVARLGGDDFAIVLENLKNSEEAIFIAQRILETMVTAFDLNDYETFITTSIGISLYPNDADDVETSLKNADAAMYRAKEKGKNNYQFFTPQMNAATHQRLLLETQLRHALDRDELMLYYQPQIHLATGQIVGAEVLLRWQNPKMGVVSPRIFIPLAEETGLIVKIGEWVLHQACLQHQKWRNRGHPILRIAVNLSSRQFKQENLMNSIVQILENTYMDPNLLELELTESMLMQDADNSIKILHQLKEMGIQLAIDDFGTGYSSLSYLRRFPIDKLKIDKSFMVDIPVNQDDMAIIRAIVALARTLNLTVIAEGVETKQQLAFLKSLRCDEIQGFFYSRPLPAEEFAQLLLEVSSQNQ
ncbi:MAG: hypothetical protein BWK79_02890, partial [Beggiatoa sp. IS2]